MSCYKFPYESSNNQMTEEEFKYKVLPFARKLYPMLRNILRNEEEAKDALQELMLKFWRNRYELAGCHHPQAYIIAMAKNYCFDILKKKRPLRMEENGNNGQGLQNEEQDFDIREKYRHVQKIIEALPEKYQAIIRLRDIDGFSFDEIKEYTGLETANIRVILSRARQKVKEEIQKIYDYEDKRQTAGEIL